MDHMKPQFEDETPVNPFDPWAGCNFKLKIRKVEGFTNYDKSEFDGASPLFEGNDEKIESLWKSQYKLQEFVAPSNFKSYDELKAKLDLVLNLNSAPETFAPSAPAPVAEESAPWVAEEKSTPQVATTSDVDDDEDDEAMSYFSKLASED